MNTKIQHKLTDPEMAHILNAISEAEELPQVDAIVETFKILMGEDAWDNATSVDPADYAIPEDQWGEIAEAVGEAEKRLGPITQVNAMLDWMNKGPSGYKEEV